MIDSKAFKKKLIDDEKTMKQWALENGFDIDRLRNILDSRVNATQEEIDKISKYVEG
jgi:hypothetical protein